ncbi:MAG: EutN/CcmL family microcompartment protein [Rhodospirillales bacterium]
MIKGRIVGRVWSTKRLGTLPQGGLLEVEVEGGSRIIAFDPLGCADGEQVLVTQGSVAAAYFEGVKAPVDALIIGSIDD